LLAREVIASFALSIVSCFVLFLFCFLFLTGASYSGNLNSSQKVRPLMSKNQQQQQQQQELSPTTPAIPTTTTTTTTRRLSPSPPSSFSSSSSFAGSLTRNSGDNGKTRAAQDAFVNHLHHVWCNGNEEDTRFILDWLTRVLHYSHRQTRTALWLQAPNSDVLKAAILDGPVVSHYLPQFLDELRVVPWSQMQQSLSNYDHYTCPLFIIPLGECDDGSPDHGAAAAAANNDKNDFTSLVCPDRLHVVRARHPRSGSCEFWSMAPISNAIFLDARSSPGKNDRKHPLLSEEHVRVVQVCPAVGDGGGGGGGAPSKYPLPTDRKSIMRVGKWLANRSGEGYAGGSTVVVYLTFAVFGLRGCFFSIITYFFFPLFFLGGVRCTHKGVDISNSHRG
jgi:hypothetical protein